jgi:hypothetical protein
MNSRMRGIEEVWITGTYDCGMETVYGVISQLSVWKALLNPVVL